MRRCIMRRRKEKGNFFCRGNWLRLAGYVFETLTSRFLFFKMDGCIENIIGYIVGAIFFFILSKYYFEEMESMINYFGMLLFSSFFFSSTYKFFETDSKWKDSKIEL